MSSEVTPDQLVEAVAIFLRERVLPTVEGDIAYEARVSANALDMVVRSLRHPPEVAVAHAERLELLLGQSGSLETLDQLLCERISAGALDEYSKALIEHLRIAAIDALSVDQPRYSALRRRLSD